MVGHWWLLIHSFQYFHLFCIMNQVVDFLEGVYTGRVQNLHSSLKSPVFSWQFSLRLLGLLQFAEIALPLQRSDCPETASGPQPAAGAAAAGSPAGGAQRFASSCRRRPGAAAASAAGTVGCSRRFLPLPLWSSGAGTLSPGLAFPSETYRGPPGAPSRRRTLPAAPPKTSLPAGRGASATATATATTAWRAPVRHCGRPVPGRAGAAPPAGGPWGSRAAPPILQPPAPPAARRPP